MNLSKNKSIVVVDYGLGNLRSVSKALESVGASVLVSSKPEDVLASAAVVLPGVGAFYRGMENLKKIGMIDTLLKVVAEKKPFLGICLGLQLLFTESDEHTLTAGLGIIEGKVIRFKENLKVPHMGWNQVMVKEKKTDIKLFEGVPKDSYFYFVHSYFVEPSDKSVILANCEYGQVFSCAVNKDNVYGMQFHPERSSTQGLKILKNFVEAVKKS